MNCILILKKTDRIRVWLACDRARLCAVASEVGQGDWVTGLKFWREKLSHYRVDLIATDDNPVYPCFLPRNVPHIVDKAETCYVESLNSSLRDNLARLNRRTKRYSKSKRMLQLSVLLWQFRKTLTLDIYS